MTKEELDRLNELDSEILMLAGDMDELNAVWDMFDEDKPIEAISRLHRFASGGILRVKNLEYLLEKLADCINDVSNAIAEEWEQKRKEFEKIKISGI